MHDMTLGICMVQPKMRFPTQTQTIVDCTNVLQCLQLGIPKMTIAVICILKPQLPPVRWVVFPMLVLTLGSFRSTWPLWQSSKNGVFSHTPSPPKKKTNVTFPVKKCPFWMIGLGHDVWIIPAYFGSKWTQHTSDAPKTSAYPGEPAVQERDPHGRLTGTVGWYQ